MSGQEQPANPVPAANGPAGQQPAGPRPQRRTFLHDLRQVWQEPGFRRLLTTRVISQAGDGAFTAGLGTYVFFNAATFPSPARGAAAFAVLYVPYSLIGPFAGVFIDRWSRRQILVYSALLRSALVAVTAALMAAGNLGAPLYIAVLLVLGVNRFFLSSLSAALPHVVAPDKLVMANSVAPTAGGFMAAIGGIAGLGLNAATGNTERGAAITLLVAGACYVAASLVAATLGREALGPPWQPGHRTGRLVTELGIVAIGLAEGARYVIRRRGPATALGATGGNRLFYGIMFLMSILLYRNYFYRGSATTAEAHYATLVTVVAIGYGSAALVSPIVTRRLTKPAYITVLLALSAVLSGVVGSTFDEVAYLVMGYFLGLASQGIAISATTVLQEQAADNYRGRMFAFYDMMFNICFVAGAAVSAQYMPATGRSPQLVVVVGAGYAALAAGYWLTGRHSAGPGVGGSMPADAAHVSNS